MWYLTSSHDKRVLYILQQSGGITIGRTADAQNCNFAIPDDQSISRKHATLTVTDNNLYIQNLGSKYGTFVNEQQLSDEKVKLNQGDVVKFGKLNSIWKVQSINFVTCTSTLKGENLLTLRTNLVKLGGVLKSDWDDTCKYLTMPGITLTIKVVLALTQAANIVTTEYWTKCLEAITNNSPLPNPKHFIPHVIESTLNKDNVCFTPNPARGTLFQGKRVVFFAKNQLDMYKPVLLKSGANPTLLSSSLTKSALAEPETIVIQHNKAMLTQESQAVNQINDIVNYIKGKGKRLVADAEIGLAILYCSLEKYCNPDFNFSTEVIKQGNGPTKQGNVLAQESQEPSQMIKRENIVIDESLVEAAGKRKLGDDSTTNANKKLATESSKHSLTLNDTVKRKLDNGHEDSQSKRTAFDTGDDDMFNFITPKGNDSENTQKKLNLSKPNKRKMGNEENEGEDDLFKFIEDPAKTEERSSKRPMFEDKREINKDKSKIEPVAEVDVSALRGSKLHELILKNKVNISSAPVKVKVENLNDLDEKMNSLDLGTTILKVRTDLIVKQEPIEIEEKHNAGRNFKKFKKIWPIHKQVTVMPKSAFSVVNLDDLAKSENREQENSVVF